MCSFHLCPQQATFGQRLLSLFSFFPALVHGSHFFVSDYDKPCRTSIIVAQWFTIQTVFRVIFFGYEFHTSGTRHLIYIFRSQSTNSIFVLNRDDRVLFDAFAAAAL